MVPPKKELQKMACWVAKQQPTRGILLKMQCFGTSYFIVAALCCGVLADDQKAVRVVVLGKSVFLYF